MSTLAMHETELPMTVDDFQALEQRVLRTVELLKAERAQRAEAERRAIAAEEQAREQADGLARAEAELANLQKDRDVVRQRIERLLKHLDELAV